MDFIFYKIIYLIFFKKKPLIIYLLITISILLILFLSIKYAKSIYSGNNEDFIEDDFLPDNKTIYFEEKFDSYREAFNKARGYLYNNSKGILTNTKKIKLSKKPKLSIVIPCYNCHKFILPALR